jgi:hypothetical protein
MMISFRRLVENSDDDGLGKRFKVMVVSDPTVTIEGF